MYLLSDLILLGLLLLVIAYMWLGFMDIDRQIESFAQHINFNFDKHKKLSVDKFDQIKGMLDGLKPDDHQYAKQIQEQQKILDEINKTLRGLSEECISNVTKANKINHSFSKRITALESQIKTRKRDELNQSASVQEDKQ